MREWLTFVYDYGQLYVYDDERKWSADASEYIDVFDAAIRAGLTIGVSSGVVDILMPRQENFRARLEVVVENAAPDVGADADHVVEFDLALPSGRLVLEGSGGSGYEKVAVPPRSYRVRLSGWGFAAAAEWSYGDPRDPGDAYRLELWPVAAPTEPAELRRWHGYDAMLG